MNNRRFPTTIRICCQNAGSAILETFYLMVFFFFFFVSEARVTWRSKLYRIRFTAHLNWGPFYYLEITRVCFFFTLLEYRLPLEKALNLNRNRNSFVLRVCVCFEAWLNNSKGRGMAVGLQGHWLGACGFQKFLYRCAPLVEERGKGGTCSWRRVRACHAQDSGIAYLHKNEQVR